MDGQTNGYKDGQMDRPTIGQHFLQQLRNHFGGRGGSLKDYIGFKGGEKGVLKGPKRVT